MVDFLLGESPSKPTSGGLALTHAGRLWNDPYAVGIDGGEYAPVWLGIMLGMNFGAQVYIRKHRGNRLCWSRLVPSTAMLIRDSAGSETLDGSVKITVMTRPVLSCVEERMLGFPAR
jgi:hypothetical protein